MLPWVWARLAQPAGGRNPPQRHGRGGAGRAGGGLPEHSQSLAVSMCIFWQSARASHEQRSKPYLKWFMRVSIPRPFALSG